VKPWLNKIISTRLLTILKIFHQTTCMWGNIKEKDFDALTKNSQNQTIAHKHICIREGSNQHIQNSRRWTQAAGSRSLPSLRERNEQRRRTILQKHCQRTKPTPDHWTKKSKRRTHRDAIAQTKRLDLTKKGGKTNHTHVEIQTRFYTITALPFIWLLEWKSSLYLTLTNSKKCK
jgi:hypothetical protein